MNTAAGEWAARVAARNEIETAKARRVGAMGLSRGGAERQRAQRDIRLLPLSAEGEGDKGTV